MKGQLIRRRGGGKGMSQGCFWLGCLVDGGGQQCKQRIQEGKLIWAKSDELVGYTEFECPSEVQEEAGNTGRSSGGEAGTGDVNLSVMGTDKTVNQQERRQGLHGEYADGKTGGTHPREPCY